MDQMEAEYEQRRTQIMCTKDRHIKKGRFVIDVLRETSSAMFELVDWKKRRAREIRGSDDVRKLVSLDSETIKKVVRHIQSTRPSAEIPVWVDAWLAQNKGAQ